MGKNILVLIIVMIFLVFAVSVNAQISRQGWVASYSFDNDNVSGGVLFDCAEGDASSDDGTIIGGLTTGATGGILGEAFDFEADDNDNQIDFTSGSEFHIAPPFTLAVWIKMESTVANSVLFGGQHSSNLNGMNFIISSDGRIGSQKFPSPVDSFSTQSINDNQLTLVVFIKNSTGQHFFINNTNAGIDLGVADWNAPSQTVEFGTLFGGERFDGIMDEMVIFSRGWNQSDVDQYYNNGVGISACSLSVPPPAPAIIAQAVLPLESVNNIVGMIALFLIIVGFIFAELFRRNK